MIRRSPVHNFQLWTNKGEFCIAHARNFIVERSRKSLAVFEASRYFGE